MVALEVSRESNHLSLQYLCSLINPKSFKQPESTSEQTLIPIRSTYHPKTNKFQTRGVTGGWAIAHPVFDRIEGAALLIAHLVFGSQSCPCRQLSYRVISHETSFLVAFSPPKSPE